MGYISDEEKSFFFGLLWMAAIGVCAGLGLENNWLGAAIGLTASAIYIHKS